MKLKALWIAICLAVTVYSHNVMGATITKTNLDLTTIGQCSIRVDGIIKTGDVEKLAEVITNLTSRITNFELINKSMKFESDEQIVICLSGPGGNYLEGISIAKLIAKYNLTTAVLDDETCLSACAVAFLGGRGCCNTNGEHIPTRYIYPGSKVGFHAPILTVQSGEYNKSDVATAYNIALDAIYKLRQLSGELSIPQTLLAKITEHRGENFYYINTLDDAELNGIRLTGYKQRKLKRDTFQAGCLNAFNWYVVGPQIPDQGTNGTPFGPRDDAAWRRVFSSVGEYGNRFIQNGSVYKFAIWDGEIGCVINRIRNRKIDLYNVILVESDDPVAETQEYLKMLNGNFRSSILMRGSRTLESTR